MEESPYADLEIAFQRRLWEEAKGKPLKPVEAEELEALRGLLRSRKVTPAGPLSAFMRIETTNDIVDALRLLQQGAGLGFEPVVGCLSGLTKPVALECRRHLHPDTGNGTGEAFTPNLYGGTWTLRVGSVPEDLPLAVDRLLSNKRPHERLVIECGEDVAPALEEIVTILNHRADRLLTPGDIIALVRALESLTSGVTRPQLPYGAPGWVEFVRDATYPRTLVLYHTPSREELEDLRALPDLRLVDGREALQRAPWFRGTDPAGAALLANKSTFRTMEIELEKFTGDFEGLCEASRLVARACYRLTVDPVIGALQPAWRELREFLRLTGVGLKGAERWDLRGDPTALETIRNIAALAAFRHADELILPRPKAVWVGGALVGQTGE
jgi:hypothetical protein